jgi:hypothetical protein
MLVMDELVSTTTAYMGKLKENHLYFPGTGKREEKHYTRNNEEMNSFLYTNSASDSDGDKHLVQVWGEKATKVYQQIYDASASQNEDRLFFIAPLEKHDPNDAENLVLLKCDPNDYQQDYKWVWKLQTRKAPGKRGKTKLSAESFPKPIKWQTNHLCYDDGALIPAPHTWPNQKRVDDSDINIDDLIQIQESPLKKMRLL